MLAWPGRWPGSRMSCSRMSRPPTSTGIPATPCSRCFKSCTGKGKRSSSPLTTLRWYPWRPASTNWLEAESKKGLRTEEEPWPLRGEGEAPAEPAPSGSAGASPSPQEPRPPRRSLALPAVVQSVIAVLSPRSSVLWPGVVIEPFQAHVDVASQSEGVCDSRPMVWARLRYSRAFSNWPASRAAQPRRA